MGIPKWECPGVSHVKIKMGPNWDQHGNAQVGSKDGSQFFSPEKIHILSQDNLTQIRWIGLKKIRSNGSQLGPTWECPSGSAQVCPMWAHQTKCSGSHLGSSPLAQCGQPHFQIETWDPLGSEVGSSWKIVSGSQFGPTCITHGQTHLGPMWAPRTKRSPSGTQVGPTWQPTLDPSGPHVAFLL